MAGQDMQVKRAKHALLVVAVMALVAFACVILSRWCATGALGLDPRVHEEPSYVGQAWKDVVQGDDLAEWIEGEGVLVSDVSEAPSWFSEEIFDPQELEGFGVVAATSDWSVVWLSAQASSEMIFALVTEQLSERGWSGYESGLDDQATFAKEEGSCTWTMVTCSQVGEETEVVMRILRK